MRLRLAFLCARLARMAPDNMLAADVRAEMAPPRLAGAQGALTRGPRAQGYSCGIAILILAFTPIAFAYSPGKAKIGKRAVLP